MLDKSIENILKNSFPPELPYGFAERVARNAMQGRGRVSIWDILLGVTPRVSLAFGAAAAILLAVGLTGDGPSLLDAVSNYDAYSTIITLP